MFRARDAWVRLSKRFKFLQTRRFCTTNNNNKPNQNNINDNGNQNGSQRNQTKINYPELYKELENPDFLTAARLMLTIPPKKQRFGFDFHLVQCFFGVMPALAIYCVAMYSRREAKRMDAELEEKQKREEEEKAKKRHEELASDPFILEMRGRIDELEETIKEIVVEAKKQDSGSKTKKQADGGVEKRPATIEPSNTLVRSESSKSAEEDHLSKPKSSELKPGLGQEKSGLAPVTEDASQHEQKGTNQSAQSSQDDKNQRKPT